MIVAETVKEVRSARWVNFSDSWGLVPTMGALHDGHLSLIKQAHDENDHVAVSIFVNPTQFNDPSDLDKYPHNMERDLELLDGAGVDLVWTPAPDEVYPPGFQTTVTVEEVTQPLEGERRPGHFQGVTTVVTKLFNVFQPTRAYFGQKDAQQVVVIRRLVADLNFNLEIVVCPIEREADGLAMSSRNALLHGEARPAARALHRALTIAVSEWEAGDRDADYLRQTMTNVIHAEPLAEIDYVSVADRDTLAELEGNVDRALLSMAVVVGGVRLIDNMVVGE